MLVRVKKELGNYGHVQNGHVQPKNYASGAFEVTAEKGQELIKRGIVEAVEESTAPAPTIDENPQPQETTAEVKKSPKKPAKATKKGAQKADSSADDAPKFDAIGGVE